MVWKCPCGAPTCITGVAKLAQRAAGGGADDNVSINGKGTMLNRGMYVLMCVNMGCEV